ncbi:ABC transporter ATP-binding protein [Anaeromyxobacter oryzae]|uniref:ABC transporter ATP-binding protein n=1 Tax=Anaeromyxobacter oryzae TaxID=2918170 RepID=A0ABM7WPN0_9BACT|nr:ABC transporter ATP-binding protein [Anaeromyxobacter oryzae]BDG01424.1 ABC transporter ATP-binding protein [Anaeromyxobacter oryzae]
MASLTLDRVTKVYQQKDLPPTRAVKDFSLSVKDGEIIGLVGSSGCGKTSTLRMIAGLESVTEGTIRVGDRPIHHLKAAERNVAMAFEGYALYPPLRVSDNIAFSLLRGRMPKEKASERVRMIADLLEISDILPLYPPNLSGGQQQRVSLARALVRDADVFLLDEPMSQLEPHLRAKLRARIKDYLIEHKMTSVFVTHDQTEAMALADRIAVMSEGVLQQLGSPVELKERPTNLFVASFIGEPTMNLLKGQTADDGGTLQVVVEDEQGRRAFAIPLPPGARGRVPNGKRVHVGLRPHKLIVGETNGRSVPRVYGTVVSNQWLGDQTYVGIEIGGCLVLAVADQHVKATVDTQVALGLAPEALHLFDVESEIALLHGGDVAAESQTALLHGGDVAS